MPLIFKQNNSLQSYFFMHANTCNTENRLKTICMEERNFDIPLIFLFRNFYILEVFSLEVSIFLKYFLSKFDILEVYFGNFYILEVYSGLNANSK